MRKDGTGWRDDEDAHKNLYIPLHYPIIMTFELAISAVIYIIGIVLIIMLLKTFFKIFITLILWTAIFCVILIALSGYVFYQDLSDFKERLSSEDNLFLLQDQGLVAGVAGKIEKDDRIYLPQDDLAFFANKPASDIQGDYYKVIIFKSEAFFTVENVDVGGSAMSGQGVLSKIMAEQDYIVRGHDFESLVKKKFDDPIAFVIDYKKGNIIIYPDLSVKAYIQVLPERVIEKVGNKVLHKE